MQEHSAFRRGATTVALACAGFLAWLLTPAVDGPAGAAYLALVPLAVTATVLLRAAPDDARARLRGLLDGLVVGGSLLFLSWTSVRGTASGYPVAGPAFAVVAAAVLALSGRRRSTVLPYLPVGVAALTAFAAGVSGAGLDGTETTIGAVVVTLVVARQLVGIADTKRLTQSLAAAMTEARAREDHFRALVQGSSDVLTICDGDGLIRFISPAVYRVFGYHPDDLIGTKLVALVHPDDMARVTVEVMDTIANPGPPVTVQCRYRCSDGTWLHVETIVSNDLDHPHIEGLVFNTRDVSERTELERQLIHQAFHDPLTGLANRALFRDRVQHALALRVRSHQPLAVLFLDLDGFKAINDSLGHGVGDLLLKEVSERLQGVVRPGDTVARLGGDEFAVLLEQELDGVHVAQHVATRFLEELRTAFALDRHEVFVGASVGIAMSADHDDADELLRNADLAMYRAKALGKNRCEVFEPDMHAAAIDRMELENDLRYAVVRNELRLHYQPIVELDTGHIVGVEALLRWEHPTRGLVQPLDFIHVAEESGLIVPVGRWVLTEACRQVARWQRDSGRSLRLAVNISARQLLAPRLAEHVAKTLRTTGIDAHNLVLEITESTLVDDAERTIAKLHLLRELGVRLAIDDFGTGYSSLNYLRRLPVDMLKIDRSFVSGICTEVELTSLTAAIVGIGRDLGLDTVAEGIEGADQLAALRSMGCAMGQGFLYARPLPPDAFAALFAEDAIGDPEVASA